MNFHIKNISKGEYGKPSKILEELEEYQDAIDQGIKIMADLELADVYGALEGLAKTHNLSMEDLKKMSDVTKKARFNSKSEHHFIDSTQIEYLSKALKFAKDNDFIEIKNLPWHVSDDVIKMTTNFMAHRTFDGNFVGSAEQSFLQLALEKKLKQNEQYVGLTPCLRNDPIDEIHDNQFYKVEMFSLQDDRMYFIDIAINFMKSIYNGPSNNFKVDSKDNSSDIFLNGIEVGSYYFKIDHEKEIMWSCGTLIAVPRFNLAM